MINADHRQGWTVTAHIDWKCGLEEGTVLVVEGHWVARVAGVTANVANYAKFAAGLRQRFDCNEWWNRLAEIDAVDEDV